MKKIILFLSLLLMSIGVWSEEQLVYTLEPSLGSNNSYAGNCDVAIDGITWNITGNSTLTPWRLGGKSLSGVNRAIYSKTAISENVTKIVITHGAASSITVNSMTIVVSKNSDFSSPVSTLTPSFVANNTITVNRPDEKDWSDCYYKIVYNVTVSSTSNKFLEFVDAKFYAEGTLYSVVFKNNGLPIDTLYTLNYMHTLPSALTNILRCKNSSIFVGWSEYDFTTTNDEPEDLFLTVKNAPRIESDKVFYAVFADEEKLSPKNENFTLIIDDKDFSGISYADNNHPKTSIAQSNSGDTVHVTWTSYQVYKNTGMLWKKGEGYIYNNTSFGTITSFNIESSAGTYTTYFGPNELPTSGTTVGNAYFKTKVSNSATGHTSKITIKFTKSIIPKRYSDYTTYCIDTLQTEGNWNNSDNWKHSRVPEFNEAAVLLKPAAVNIPHATAKYVIIDKSSSNTGKLTIQSNKGLEVQDTISVYDGTYHVTTPHDLVLESSSEGNASLIFNNNNESQATVCLYSKANVTDDQWNWQYMGTAMTELNALYNYYGSWIYRWDKNGGWIVVPNGGTMNAWTGYCIIQENPEWYATTGTLIPTDGNDVTLEVSANSNMVFANSWTAPIHVSKFTDETFQLDTKNVYLFNTGSDINGTGEIVEKGNEPGTYIVMPIYSSPYTGDSLIAPQLGFYVKTGSSNGTVTLKYNELVRTNGSSNIIAGPMRAPKRTNLNEPDVMKIYVVGSKYSDKAVILEREDFSTGFDNGWDGDKFSFGVESPSIYVINENGTYDAVSAISDYEGTVIGFKACADSIYTLSFDYSGEENWYLNDVITNKSTIIQTGNEYRFTSNDSDDFRFVISSTPYSNTTTDIFNTDCKYVSKKYIHNGSLYILENNRIFNAIGNLIR